MRKRPRPECSRIGSFKIWTKQEEGSPKGADGRRLGTAGVGAHGGKAGSPAGREG